MHSLYMGIWIYGYINTHTHTQTHTSAWISMEYSGKYTSSIIMGRMNSNIHVKKNVQNYNY